ncbi:MAG: HlyC/CorC family transporter [Gammaproteobacteria bacterium]|nr:MAG: HlyC/CorC family transporter [Gammaproteobacteria bacterium]
MDELSDGSLLVILIILIIVSAFFSSSETGMMSLNRYRLKHRVKQGDKSARRVADLLKYPDRLIGLILIGNNFVNILASAIATVLATRIWGPDLGVAIATFGLTLIVLIFAEVTPKTLAALAPERIAYPAAWLLKPLLTVFYPLVRLINFIAALLMRPFGIQTHGNNLEALTAEELRSVVNEAGALIPKSHQRMLLSVLELEQVTVEDIMVPKAEIVGIDLEDDWPTVVQQLKNMQHTRVPVYEGEIDDVIGMLHVRDLANLVLADELTPERFREELRPVTFVPEGTPLSTQLLKFKAKKERVGLVVDEYGDVLGLVTLDDILEEIVGEFTTDVAEETSPDIVREADGSVIVDGSITIRELNKALGLHLPTDGPKTLSGLVVEYLETIPKSGTGVRIAGCPMDILHVKDNRIRTLRLYPALAENRRASPKSL